MEQRGCDTALRKEMFQSRTYPQQQFSTIMHSTISRNVIIHMKTPKIEQLHENTVNGKEGVHVQNENATPSIVSRGEAMTLIQF